MRHGSLFTGIGGFDLAAEWMGWENVFQVEWDGFCQKVLAKNFPNVKRYGDIKEFDGTKYRGLIDIISGGFPCQPFSHAGKRKGKSDDRYLWPEMLRVIREIKPSFIVGENVGGLISMENGKTLDKILFDLGNEGYATEQFIIPACATGAWHRRDRIWIFAYSINSTDRTNRGQGREEEVIQGKYREKGLSREFSGTGEQIHVTNSNGTRGTRIPANEINRCCGNNGRENAKILQDDTNSNCQGLQGSKKTRNIKSSRAEQNKQFTGCNRNEIWDFEPSVGRVANGIPDRVDRLKGLGNAIVPQVVFQIFKAIEDYERTSTI